MSLLEVTLVHSSVLDAYFLSPSAVQMSIMGNLRPWLMWLSVVNGSKSRNLLPRDDYHMMCTFLG